MNHLNPYQVLNITPNATQKEIKMAYRQLVKRFHPDSQQHTANHQKIIEINAAYEILGDTQRRQQYDQAILEQSPFYRLQKRTAAAQRQYQCARQANAANQYHSEQWLQTVYCPLHQYIYAILHPLAGQIDQLAADPFDDELMENFQNYIENCRISLDQALRLFSSQPNPSNFAKVAAEMYYCLTHLGDGIEDLRQFTLNYDDHYLHSGQEFFRRAAQLHDEAKQRMASIR